MVQTYLTFRTRGRYGVAAAPAGLSVQQQIALACVHYCMPTLPGQPRGLLLCNETAYETWLQEWERVPIESARRICFLLHAQIEIRRNLRIRIPRSLLACGGIQEDAVLTFQTDGSILITPPPVKEHPNK